MKRRILFLAVLPLFILALAPLLAQPAGPRAAATALPPDSIKWVFLSAAIVAGLAAVGAAVAVAVVGSAAMGAVAEKPETAGRALIFVGLAEGIAIYGLIIAIMILGRLP